MLRRIILGIILVISIIWIGFSVLQNYQQGGEISIQTVFNEQDENIVIINRINEFSENLIPKINDFESSEWLVYIDNKEIERISLSESQNKVLFEFKKDVSPTDLSKIFGDNIEFNLGKISKINGKKAWIHQDLLFISEKDNSRQENDFHFDSKATACEIQFTNQKIEVTEIYLRSNDKIEYLHQSEESASIKINDAEYFAYVIPNSIESYWFQEKNFVKQLGDTVFDNSPMNEWLNTGFVTMDFMNSKVILTDYADGNDPLFVLENMEKTSDTNWFSTPLHMEFPMGEKYVVKPLEDFMVISESESACDQFIANYKLGKTLALSPSALEKFYGHLPKMVSERYVSESEKRSKSTYNGQLLTTVLKGGNDIQIAQTQDVISLPVSFSIQNIATLKGIGNAIATGSNGEIAAFLNQKITWSKKIDKIKSLEIIDFLGNGQQHILLSTESDVHLFNKNGNYVNGFPISLDDQITSAPKFYRWKGAPFILASTDKKEILQFDSRGRERFAWKCNKTVSKPINVWASQGKLFWGIQSNSEFVMYNVKDQREHRTFPLAKNAIALKIPNELIHFQMSGNKLERVDQKGTTLAIKQISSGKILNQNNNKSIAAKEKNELLLFNNEGMPFSEIRIPFNEFSKGVTFSRSNGQSIVSVIDELENNIYIYNTKGDQLYGKTFEGKSKVILQEEGAKLILSTILDGFIVQYILN